MIGEVFHMHWRDLAEHVRSTVGQVDALITDCPYGAATHRGHDASVGLHANGTSDRRAIDYAAWTPADVAEFVATWSPLVRGWMCSLTSDDLGQHWRAAYVEAGRQAFAAIPATETGSTDRKLQDGPASWTTHLMVARPRGKGWIGWGQPRSYYLGPREAKPVVGGKPVWLISQILEDYTSVGQLVADPCCGGGTLGVSCKLLGRYSLQGDIDASHVEIARERLRALPTAPKKGTMALPWGDQ